LLLALPTAVALIVAADSILVLFVTGAAAAWPILIVLTFARGIEAAVSPAGAIQQVISHRGMPVLNSTIGLVVATLVLLYAFPMYEAVGVAMGVAMGQIVIALLSVWQLSRMEKLKAFDSSSFKIIVTALLACTVILFTGSVTINTPPLIKGSTLLITYLLAIWLSVRIALPANDRAALGKFGRRLRLAP